MVKVPQVLVMLLEFDAIPTVYGSVFSNDLLASILSPLLPNMMLPHLPPVPQPMAAEPAAVSAKMVPPVITISPHEPAVPVPMAAPAPVIAARKGFPLNNT